MITDNKLVLFESFRIDRKLPKYTKLTSVYRTSKGGDENVSEEGWEPMMSESGMNITIGEKMVFTPANFRDVGSNIQGRSRAKKLGIFGWFKWFKYLINYKREERAAAKIPTISIAEFFASVKNSVQELELIRERAAGYERAMIQACSTGQTALLEKLKQGLETNRNEGQLIAIDNRKFLTEEDLVRFVKVAKKGLRLDWVGNFTRMIPSEIVERKIRMDELGIFDNYAVLHYDPKAKSWSETEAEKVKRIRESRDPILFGLMTGSRRLYFVGDWVDEQCDLTLEQIIDQLGIDTVKLLEAPSKELNRVEG
jgi:hypothetical protein